MKEAKAVMIPCSGYECIKAKGAEVKNWIDSDVFEEVESHGQKAISTRWIIIQKVKSGTRVIMTRIVARGLELNAYRISHLLQRGIHSSLKCYIRKEMGLSCFACECCFLTGPSY